MSRRPGTVSKLQPQSAVVAVAHFHWFPGVCASEFRSQVSVWFLRRLLQGLWGPTQGLSPEGRGGGAAQRGPSLSRRGTCGVGDDTRHVAGFQPHERTETTTFPRGKCSHEHQVVPAGGGARRARPCGGLAKDTGYTDHPRRAACLPEHRHPEPRVRISLHSCGLRWRGGWVHKRTFWGPDGGRQDGAPQPALAGVRAWPPPRGPWRGGVCALFAPHKPETHSVLSLGLLVMRRPCFREGPTDANRGTFPGQGRGLAGRPAGLRREGGVPPSASSVQMAAAPPCHPK